MRSESDIASLNILIDVYDTITSERRLPMNELVKKDTESPDVYFLIIRLLIKDLRCHILVCATESLSHLILLFVLSAPAKITDLDVELFIEQNILGLQVSMNETFLVHVVNGLASLSKELYSPSF